jgi:hypothetical protein
MKVRDKQEEIKMSGTNKFLVYVDILKYRAEEHMVFNKQQSGGWCRKKHRRKKLTTDLCSRFVTHLNKANKCF